MRFVVVALVTTMEFISFFFAFSLHTDLRPFSILHRLAVLVGLTVAIAAVVVRTAVAELQSKAHQGRVVVWKAAVLNLVATVDASSSAITRILPVQLDRQLVTCACIGEVVRHDRGGSRLVVACPSGVYAPLCSLRAETLHNHCALTAAAATQSRAGLLSDNYVEASRAALLVEQEL